MIAFRSGKGVIMSAEMTCREGAEIIESMRSALESNPDVAAVRKYAEQTAADYKELMEQASFKALGAAVKDTLDFAVSPIYETAE